MSPLEQQAILSDTDEDWATITVAKAGPITI